MAEMHGKYRAHESEDWHPVLLRRRDAQLEIVTHAGHILAIWSGGHLERLNFPLLGRQWLLRDQRVAHAQLMVENDEDYAALREIAPQLSHPRQRALRQLGSAALGTSQLARIIAAALVPIIGLWLLIKGGL